MDATADVAVVGGGVIGLACAWRLAARGLAVTVVDPRPGSGATHAAAGMLAPVTEAHYGEEALAALTLAAVRAYPRFVAELQDASGTDVGYRECGTLTVALDAGDRAALADLVAFQAALGLKSTLLTRREARTEEPMLAAGIAAAALAPGDHQVDPRRLSAALLCVARHAGVRFLAGPATALRYDRSGTGVALADGGALAAGTVLLAAGCRSAALAPPGLAPVRPVKGEILRLSATEPPARRTVRALVAGHSCYVVPRDSGEVVVGATVEEQGYDTTVRTGAVHELLRDALEALPGLAECRFAEACAGLRPGTPDNAPIVGRAGPPGLLLATGHYRNGVLLAPLTAEAVVAAVADEPAPPAFAAFPADRFARAAVPG